MLKEQHITTGCPADSVELSENGDLEVSVCGHRWTFCREADLESLWADLDDSDPDAEDNIPYWAEVWPASILVSRMIERNRALLRGRHCLDLGCGLGVTAIIASSFGAEVVAFDHQFKALHYAHRNAEINNVPQPLWLQMDWNHPGLKDASFPFIWGGDIVYEKRFFEPLEKLMRRALAPGGRVWMGEPVRTVSRTAWDRFRQRGWDARKVTTEEVPNQGATVTVNLWELTRG